MLPEGEMLERGTILDHRNVGIGKSFDSERDPRFHFYHFVHKLI